MIRRAEILIAPWDAMPVSASDALARCLGRTLDNPKFLSRSCGPGQIIVIAYVGEVDCENYNEQEELVLTEGHWPEPLGLQLKIKSKCENPSWNLESDVYGVRPIYFGIDKLKRTVVSTRPEMVAALLGSRPSALSLAEQILVGYTLENHTVFEDVFRLRPQRKLSYSKRDGCSICDTPIADCKQPDDSLSWTEDVQPIITKAFEGDYALELSGGVDSRLVLALGLNAGVKPRLAFTLGSDDEEDVQIARLICKAQGINHFVLPVKFDKQQIASDGFDFVRRSGFAVNASSYAWFPSAFNSLSSKRCGQIGGGGGECASGYYYSPIDHLGKVTKQDQLWVQSRLFKSGVDLMQVFGQLRSKLLTSDVVDSALRGLSQLEGTLRERSDEFYLTQRVPNAGGPVLAASACWYLPLQPLLRSSHLKWTKSLSSEQRAGRKYQMQIIYDLVPEIGTIRYSHNRSYMTTPLSRLKQGVRKVNTTAGKIKKRLAKHRSAPDQGASSVSKVLFEDKAIQQSILEFAVRDEICAQEGRIMQMFASPSRYSHELGVLLSAAWGAKTLQQVSREITAASEENQVHQVA